MPTVKFNPQSFAIDGRRTWIVGASMHYARSPVESWAELIQAVRQAGFNTIQTACPWMLHEPRRGKFDFEGGSNVRRFIEACGAADLRVVIGLGPFIGQGYAGGGLPGWLNDLPGIALREANEVFLEHAGRYLRRLVTEIADLQVTAGGPILLVQSEHAWNCANPEQAERYLGEIARIMRENGVAVPIINANDLWVESSDTIDTWRGRSNLLRNVRQLRIVQDDAPRVVTGFRPTEEVAWGDRIDTERHPEQVLKGMAEILAAGGQPVVCPFHGGTNFGFLAGRLPGRIGALATTAAAPGAPLGEAGAKTDLYRAVRRLAHFASHFGYVFADLDPDYQPVTLDPDQAELGGGGTRGPMVSTVPLRGGQGRIVFVFADRRSRQAVLLLDDGVQMPIHLGDQLVGWYVLNVDLRGQGRLDYANLCPFAMVGRSTVVLQGPEKFPVRLSMAGSSFEAQVPTGKKPLVFEHKGITFVVCNQTQIDATYHDDETVYVGIDGFDRDGEPVPAAGFGPATVIGADGQVSALRSSTKRAGGGRSTSRQRGKGASSRSEIELEPFETGEVLDKVTGESPRYASLDGPQTLAACGASDGFGWYRIETRVTRTGKRLCHLPKAGDRVHLYVDGEFKHLFGLGPDAEPGPFELHLTKGSRTIVALVENMGRFSDGNDLLTHQGLFDHLYEVKGMRSVKPKRVSADPVDPFRLRGFISDLSRSQPSDTEQLSWTFTHARKTPVLVDVCGAAASGTLILNDVPVAYCAGASGGLITRVMLDPPSMETFRRGKNVLRFAPDPHQPDALSDVAKHTTLYECVSAITATGTWSFAKWEAPAAAHFQTLNRTELRRLKGKPCWWRTKFTLSADASLPIWLQTAGLSKGQVYVNGQNLGRYFTARADGRAVGPQTSLLIPRGYCSVEESNQLLIFDENGFDPSKVKLVMADTGDFEG